MGIGGLGMWEIVLIFLVVLLLFGAKRLPEIGSSLGKGIREFKSSVREIEKEINTPSTPEDGEEETRSLQAGAQEQEKEPDEGEREPRRLRTEE